MGQVSVVHNADTGGLSTKRGNVVVEVTNKSERPSMVLCGVKFVKKEGQRRGCFDSGWLGEVHGDIVDEGQFLVDEIARAITVKWDGDNWIAANRKHIAGAAYVILSGKSALALDPVYAT